MNISQKKQQQHEAWLKQQSRLLAGKIKDKYSEVKSIKIKRKYVDFDTDNEFIKKPEIWNVPVKTAYALFEIKCPMYECIDGGFDLKSVIARIIKNKTTHKKGAKTCPGWQDQERVGKHRCMTKLLYEVDVEYNPTT